MIKYLIAFILLLALSWTAFSVGHLRGYERRLIEEINSTWTVYKAVDHFSEVGKDKIECRRALNILSTMLLAQMDSGVKMVELQPGLLGYSATLPYLLAVWPRLRVPADYYRLVRAAPNQMTEKQEPGRSN